MSWGIERETLSVNSLAAVVVGLDGSDSVLLLVNPAALVGDLNDIEELLADVGGDGDGGGVALLGMGPEDGIGPLLGTGGGLEVGVIVLLQDIDGELEQTPVQGFLEDTVVGDVPPQGTGTGQGYRLGILACQDDMVGAVGVAAALTGQRVLGESLLATKYEPIGNERQKPPDSAVSPCARVDSKVGVEVVYGGGLGLGRGVGELNADSGQELVEDLPDAPGVDGVLIPPHLVAGGPAVHESPAVDAMDNK
ncbi:MAG: hypothetical protein U9M91_01105 [Chloroflexota bacterium]|nr:hypothetical protein [Chloroflexota bacterium]